MAINFTKLSTYDYHLPENLIAQTPLEKRDESRLLVFDRKTKDTYHRTFKDIKSFLRKGDVLVVNNTRVMPARLMAKKDTGAQIEVFLLKRKNLTDFEVLMKPAKRVKVGMVLTISEELKCELIEVLDNGNRVVRFIHEGLLEDILDRVGSMPLPHYIHEKLKDKERYQTVYSKEEGSAAAPTAGLHFTPELLDRIKAKGVRVEFVTLHVGLGTFRPVSVDNILDHKMHSEHYHMPKETADAINETKKNGGRVIAVGTTSCRTIESVAKKNGMICEDDDWTEIFIYPGYEFKGIDALITNFHLPESTLIMLVSALAGREHIINAYNTAVEERYRFFSFGDAMFIR